MKITESHLKQLVFEEVYNRRMDEIIVEELFRVLAEQDGDVTDEQYLEMWKEKPQFRDWVRDTFTGFDALSSIKKKAIIIALGMMAAGTTQFTADYAAQSQAQSISSELAADADAAEERYFGTIKDLKNFRDAATAEGAPAIDIDDAKSIEAAKDKFMAMGITKAPIVPDRVIAMQTGENVFGYTPADYISDDEIMPFVGMSKADWETIVRSWLKSPEGRERLEKWTGTSEKTQALFWGYGPQGSKLFSGAYDERPEGRRGLWLPPEWSVAYDVIQKNKARAGNIKESFKKYLHSLTTVL